MLNKLLFAKKRKDRWWRFNTLKTAFSQAQHARDSTVEKKALSNAFSRMGYGRVPTGIMPLWHALIDLGATRKPVLLKTNIERTEAISREVDPHALSFLCWLDFCHLCIGMGLYSLAEIMRNHALAKAAADVSAAASLDHLYVGFYAEAEAGNFESARALLKKMRRSGCAEDRLEQAEWFCRILSGDREHKGIGFNALAEPVNLDFARFIEGKKIALVGPVASSTEQGAEIDAHDVVVKFSYRGGDKGRDPKTQGQRLDVSYYNNTQAEALAEADFANVLSGLRWGVCINRKGLSRFPTNYPKLRVLSPLEWMLPDTHFNAGPNAVLDLLRFNPAGIRVFNTDMMLSAGRFSGYRLAGAKPIDYTRSFIKTHDPFLQYEIMQRLWHMGSISGDPRFDEVMAMGLRRYTEQLQQAHGANEQALF